MSHAAHTNKSCRTYEWVMSHIRMSHVTHVEESCRTCEWVTSYIWMSHVTHMNESCHTCEWVMSHMWMSRVTHMNEKSNQPTPHVCKGYAEIFFKTYMRGWLVGFFSKTKFFLKEKYLYNGPFCGLIFSQLFFWREYVLREKLQSERDLDKVCEKSTKIQQIHTSEYTCNKCLMHNSARTILSIKSWSYWLQSAVYIHI